MNGDSAFLIPYEFSFSIQQKSQGFKKILVMMVEFDEKAYLEFLASHWKTKRMNTCYERPFVNFKTEK